MRDIQFRGLRVDGKGWVSGFYYNRNQRHSIIENTVEFFSIQVIPESVGQFTGLQDQNGVDIYEGDVVRILYTDWISKSEDDPRTIPEYMNDISAKGEIQFKYCEFGVKICSDLLDSIFCGKHGFIEVIGNIHE